MAWDCHLKAGSRPPNQFIITHFSCHNKQPQSLYEYHIKTTHTLLLFKVYANLALRATLASCISFLLRVYVLPVAVVALTQVRGLCPVDPPAQGTQNRALGCRGVGT